MPIFPILDNGLPILDNGCKISRLLDVCKSFSHSFSYLEKPVT